MSTMSQKPNKTFKRWHGVAVLHPNIPEGEELTLDPSVRKEKQIWSEKKYGDPINMLQRQKVNCFPENVQVDKTYYL